jgi:alpha,alpha-trehalose-phosphate synthase [UDP-forming]
VAETRDSLRHLIRRKLRKHRFVVVSNREPYVHVYRNGHVEWERPASGMAIALDPVMRASGGLWVAHGGGAADAEASDTNGLIHVPPDHPSYLLKRVWLTKEQESGYYYGFANSALWPLCHLAYRRPVFRAGDWEAYREVNRLFAERVAEEVGDDSAFVFIQDYHFALLPRMLRALSPRAILAQFWHIPWPNPEVFRICPWKEEILEGLLGNDILGFHIRYHCEQFMATVDRELEARPDSERSAIVYRGHMTKIRAFPISIDFEGVSRQAASPETHRLMAVLRRKYRLAPDCILGVGADRIDYTKGLLERMEALDCFFDRYPEYRGRMVFFQVGAPSRTQIEEYRRLNEELDERVAAINWKYGGRDWQPVIFIREHLPLPGLLALYRMARFLMVTSLHDGMNLVAKEFIAAQVERTGVLLLSRFTGAARELRDALVINPYSPDETAEAIHQAVEMEPGEVRRRMVRLRAQVGENNVYKWAAEIIGKFSKMA